MTEFMENHQELKSLVRVSASRMEPGPLEYRAGLGERNRTFSITNWKGVKESGSSMYFKVAYYHSVYPQ
jgi:hypothetical protein